MADQTDLLDACELLLRHLDRPYGPDNREDEGPQIVALIREAVATRRAAKGVVEMEL